MDQLWAPWRLAYIANSGPPAAEDACFICRGLAEADDRAHLIAYRGFHCAVVLNRFPYNNGHLMVAPNAHKGQMGRVVIGFRSHKLLGETILPPLQASCRAAECTANSGVRQPGRGDEKCQCKRSGVCHRSIVANCSTRSLLPA